MTDLSPENQPAIPMPRTRACPYAPPEEYRTLREQRPVSRLAMPDGSEGWLLTRYADIRMMLSDPRFSSKNRLSSAQVRVLTPELAEQMNRRASLVGMDPPEHSRLRRLLTRQFSARRMGLLTPWIEQVVAEHLDAMQAAGSPADLVSAFALPVPSLVICELLGVPYADRTDFQRRTQTFVSLAADPASAARASAEIGEYLRRLVQLKRAHPADDLLSGLARPADPATELTDDELTDLGALLLIAGHETTANMIGLGTFLLLQRPAEFAALRGGAEVVERAVEELLRYLSVLQFGLIRRPVEDVRVGDQVIRAGEMVVGSVLAANHDPEQFPQPERLDLEREPTPHLAFGYGMHQCVGQQLARVEMRIAFAALAHRFPTLRLAVPAEQVPMRHDMLVYGVHKLPVAWDATSTPVPHPRRS